MFLNINYPEKEWQLELVGKIDKDLMANYTFLLEQFEMQGNHLMAMKHFRVAWDLEPTYLPARQNLEVFGNTHSNGLLHTGQPRDRARMVCYVVCTSQ